MAIKTSSDNNNFDDEDLGDVPIVAEINVTPLVDIFLLLLVIFMVTSSFITTSSIPVQLPQSTQGASQSQDTTPVIVTVNSDGSIFVNTVKVSKEQVFEALKLSLEKSQDKTVVLEGDREAVLGTIVEIMDLAKKAGAVKFSMATQSAN